MKSVIVDDAQLYLGSMNLDMRSAELNTELGLIIDSKELVDQINRFIEAARWYTLRLNPSDEIQWVENAGGHSERTFSVPPETSGYGEPCFS